MRQFSFMLLVLGLLLLGGAVQGAVVYTLLDIGPSGQRVESLFYDSALAVGTANADDNGANFNTTGFTSETGDAFTLAISNIDETGTSQGGIDWRDRGDSVNDTGSLVIMAEDFIKNNSGVIRLTLGSLPPGLYSATSWHNDCDNSQSDQIKAWVDTGNGFVDTGVAGTATIDIGGPDSLTFDAVEATKAQFDFTVSGTDDVHIVFNGSASPSGDNEAPLNGLYLEYTPLDLDLLTAKASSGWNLASTWIPSGAATVPSDATEVVVGGYHVSVTTANAAAAMLSVNNTVNPGQVTIAAGNALAVGYGLSGDGTIALANGATLTTDGSIGTLQFAGTGALPATLNAVGNMVVGSLTDGGSAGVFHKMGGGTLTVDAVTTVAGSTIQVDDSTLVASGAKPLGNATTIRLDDATLQLTGQITPTVAPGAIAYWSFDDPANRLRNLANPGVHDGTAVGTQVDYVPDGAVGDALQLNTVTPDAPDSAIDLGNFNSDMNAVDRGLNFHNEDFTISAWVRSTYMGDTGGDGRKETIFGNGDDNAGGHRYAMIVREGANIKVNMIIDDNADDVADPVGSTTYNKEQFTHDSDVGDGDWHHVVGQRDGTKLRMYVDGVEESIDIDADYNMIGIEQSNAFLGAITNHGDDTLYKFFRGEIDEVRVYNSAISATQVNELMGLVPLDMSTQSLLVSGDSTIQVGTATNAILGNVTMTDAASLQIRGVAASISGLELATGATQVTLDTQVPTTVATINAAAATGATITKAGGSPLTVHPSASTVLPATATVETTAGSLIGYHDDTNAPFGAAKLSLNGGNLVLSATPGVTDGAVDYPNAVEASGGVINVGPAAAGHAGPMVVNLGSAATQVNLTGDVELKTATGYELNVVGKVVSDGSVTVDGATVTLADADSAIRTLNVVDGEVSASGVRIANRFHLGGTNFTISGAPSFSVADAAESTDLLSGTDISVSGGVLSVTPTTPVLAYWSGNNAGNPGNDDSGNGHHLTLRNGATTDPAGKFGAAFTFDGVSDQDATDDDAEDYLSGLSELTVAMWVNLDDSFTVPPGVDMGIWEARGSGNNDVWGLRYDERSGGDGGPEDVLKGAMTFDTSGGNANRNADQYVSAEGTQTTAWQHTVYTWKSGEGAKLYLDGVLDTPSDATDTTVGLTAMIDHFTIGDGSKAYWNGMIDEVYILDVAVDPATVTALKNNTFGVSPDVVAPLANLIVTGDSVVTSGSEAVELGNLTVQPGVTALGLQGAVYAFDNASIGGDMTLTGEMEVRGTLDVGDGVAHTLTVDDGELVLGSGSTCDVDVRLGDGAAVKVATDKVALIGGAFIYLDGTLAPKGVGRTKSDFFSVSTPDPLTVVDNVDGGIEGVVDDPNDPLDKDYRFAAVDPVPADDKTAHIGQGAFLRGVNYNRFGGVTTSVDLDVFVALGGDGDGDGKVWLSDWAALRANFGNTGTGKTWTEGNFDPWADDKVWLSDWAALRANFGNASYVPAAGAAAVPEPGTIAMLLGGLIGLALFGWRRRRA
ncbi:MAG: PEP-CTERM sorting domain-containing protein [Candidatus Nealsonbacteria bacterium]|nr:PEP-CTERM sorting domain-containing protein [Candidatus Nealsonbacteria bacterium]